MDLIDRSKIDFYKLTGPELKSAMEEAPSVPAIPLEPLCKLLAPSAACTSGSENLCKKHECALCWEQFLTKWMEEQDADRQ